MKQGGTGGANTNANGLKFESNTDLAKKIVDELSDKYELKEHIFPESLVKPIDSKAPVYDVYNKSTKMLVGIITKQKQFYNVLFEVYGLKNIHSKTWKPDEVFFNLARNTVFIVEKNGSKLMDPLMKNFLVLMLREYCIKKYLTKLIMNQIFLLNSLHY